MDYKKVYEEWLSNPYFDEATKAELRGIADNEMRSKNGFMQSWSLVQQVCAVLSELVSTV